jgi:hypothetical protein
MSGHLDTLLKNNILEKEPPADLSGLILRRINRRRIRAARLRFGIFFGLSLVSISALAPALQYFVSEFYSSGFYNYVTLALSDSGSILTYWKEFGFALADSFPTMAAAAVFSALFVLLGSIRNLSRDIRVTFISRHVLA